MKAIEKVTRASHLIDMDDIIREGNPTLRAVAEDVTFPFCLIRKYPGWKNDAILAPFTEPVYGWKTWAPWRSWTPLPLSWIISNIIAVWYPIQKDADELQKKPIAFVMYNPKVGAHSVQMRLLATRKASLCRPQRPRLCGPPRAWQWSISQKMGKETHQTPRGYNSIVVQHENLTTHPTASCSMTTSAQTTHLKSKKDSWF